MKRTTICKCFFNFLKESKIYVGLELLEKGVLTCWRLVGFLRQRHSGDEVVRMSVCFGLKSGWIYFLSCLSRMFPIQPLPKINVNSIL